MNWDADHAAKSILECGFEILVKNEFFPRLKFFDIGALYDNPCKYVEYDGNDAP